MHCKKSVSLGPHIQVFHQELLDTEQDSMGSLVKWATERTFMIITHNHMLFCSVLSMCSWHSCHIEGEERETNWKMWAAQVPAPQINFRNLLSLAIIYKWNTTNEVSETRKEKYRRGDLILVFQTSFPFLMTIRSRMNIKNYFNFVGVIYTVCRIHLGTECWRGIFSFFHPCFSHYILPSLNQLGSCVILVSWENT